ncbi:hypothetical protein CR513_01702, partial [Mucuna pruriens]
MFLLQEFDIEIRDKSGTENLVADHLSRIERRINPLPIRDDFPDEQLMQLDGINLWFVDIVNYLIASILPLKHQNHIRIKLRMMLNIMCGMIHIYGNFVVIRSFASVYQTMRSSQYSSGHYTSHQIARKVLDSGFYCLPFLRMPITSLPPTSSAKELEWPLPASMRCPSNLFFFVRSLMFGVLTSWIHFLFIMVTLIFCLLLIMFQDGWRLRPPKLMKLKSLWILFGVPKALINDQGSHFCNKTMSTLLKKYGVVHRVATTYHPQTNRQVEVFNRKIKQILQKVVNPNRKDWSWLLEDAL